MQRYFGKYGRGDYKFVIVNLLVHDVLWLKVDTRVNPNRETDPQQRSLLMPFSLPEPVPHISEVRALANAYMQVSEIAYAKATQVNVSDIVLRKILTHEPALSDQNFPVVIIDTRNPKGFNSINDITIEELPKNLFQSVEKDFNVLTVPTSIEDVSKFKPIRLDIDRANDHEILVREYLVAHNYFTRQQLFNF